MTRREVVQAAYQAVLTLPSELPVSALPLLRALPDTEVLTFQQALERGPLTPAQVSKLMETCEGATVHLRSGHRVVLFQGGGLPGRRRFTLAHELGHNLLRHTGADMPTEEAEANLFACHFLMPVPLIRLLRAEHRLNAQTLASACGVTESAARVMLQRPLIPVEEALWQQVEAWCSTALAARDGNERQADVPFMSDF